MISSISRSASSAAQILGLASFAMMAAALFFEHVMGLHPCQMCIWQRVPHIVVIAFGAASLLPIMASYHRIIIMMMALALLGGAGIAFWHSGVELKLLPGPSACSAAMSLEGDPGALLDQILAAPTVRCDEVPWSFLGLSMANWNFIITLGMAGFASLSVLKTKTPLPEIKND